MKRICVFCGSSSGEDPRHLETATRFGEELVRLGFGLVYGGSRMGLMGRLADTMIAGGGEVIGVIPEPLVNREVAHQGLTELFIVESMHARKSRMMELAEGFVGLPGGLGTLEELFEVLTWAQLGLHRKPCGILNARGYFRSLIAHLDHAVTEGFLLQAHRDLVHVASEPAELLAKLRDHDPPDLPRWIDPEET